MTCTTCQTNDSEDAGFRTMAETLSERTDFARRRVRNLQKDIFEMADLSKWRSSWGMAKRKRKQRRVDKHYRIVNDRSCV